MPNHGKLTITTGAVLQNSAVSKNGGAVYVAKGGTVTMNGGTVYKNESVGNGAGIYLAEGSTLNLSGSPYFGGTDVDAQGTPILPEDSDGNFKEGELEEGKTNGGKESKRARQDIFIAGYASKKADDTNAASLVVKGDIIPADEETSAAGSIWVWVEHQPHYKTLEQFAKYDRTNVKDPASTLAAFRNARPDDETGAGQVGEYLHGTTKSDDIDGNVFWHGLEGSARVMLVKVEKIGEQFKPKPGMTFTVYTDSSKSTVAKGTILNSDGEEEGIELRELTSGDGGAFFIGTMPYGNYYIEEENVGYFEITVDSGGVVKITDPTTTPKTTEPVKFVYHLKDEP